MGVGRARLLADGRGLRGHALGQVVGELQVAVAHPRGIGGGVGAQLVGRGQAHGAEHAVAVAVAEAVAGAQALDVAREGAGQVGARVDVRAQRRARGEERVLVVEHGHVQFGDGAFAVGAPLHAGGDGLARARLGLGAVRGLPARARVAVVAGPAHEAGEVVAARLEEHARAQGHVAADGERGSEFVEVAAAAREVGEEALDGVGQPLEGGGDRRQGALRGGRLPPDGQLPGDEHHDRREGHGQLRGLRAEPLRTVHALAVPARQRALQVEARDEQQGADGEHEEGAAGASLGGGDDGQQARPGGGHGQPGVAPAEDGPGARVGADGAHPVHEQHEGEVVGAHVARAHDGHPLAHARHEVGHAVREGVARGVGLGGGHDEGEAEQQGGGLHEPLGGAGARRRQSHHHAPDDGGGERGEVAHPLRLLDGHGEGRVGDQRGDQREPVLPAHDEARGAQREAPQARAPALRRRVRRQPCHASAPTALALSASDRSSPFATV